MPSTLMRDSSADYRTYWLQGGQYYSKMRNLGDPAACELPADKLAQFSDLERKAILDEAAGNPGLCRKLYSIMTKNPNWKRVIESSMRSAVANALNHRIGEAGPWRKLQETAKAMVDRAFSEVDQKVNSLTLGQKMQVIQSIATAGKPTLSGIGLGDIFSDLIGGVADYFGNRTIARAQESIARTQANATIAVANAQMSVAQANAAIVAAQERISSPISSVVSTLTSTTVAGVPILIPILGAVGLALWFAFGKK